MEIHLDKAAVAEFLWLQKLVERRLIAETLRRAIVNVRVPLHTKSLWCAEVVIDELEATNVIYVHYDAPTGDRRPNDRKAYTETYTLAEALRLCLEERWT